MKLPAPSLAGNRQTILAALLTLALLVAVTLGLWWNSSAESTQIARQRFDFKLAEAQVATQQRLLAYEQVLRGAVGLFVASEDVTRDEWATYVRTLEIEKNFLGIQGIGYSPHVLRADLAAHRQRIRGEGLADYAIQPPGERAEYAPIVFMEPADWRNARALGYDMFTDPALREPLKRAQDTDLPSVSGKVKLAQEVADGVQSGFVMCLPVFRKGAAHATIDERQAALDGYLLDLPYGRSDAGHPRPEQLPIRLRVPDGCRATESQCTTRSTAPRRAADAIVQRPGLHSTDTNGPCASIRCRLSMPVSTRKSHASCWSAACWSASCSPPWCGPCC